jgi:hypothetical protein
MTEARDVKVMEDLSTLSERIVLCSEMLSQSSSPQLDEALLDVVGFLEACVPRLIDLIEAASQGVLSEVTLMKCLEVNDSLLSVLSESDGTKPKGSTAQAVAQPANSTAAAAAAPSNVDLMSSPAPVGGSGGAAAGSAAAAGGNDLFAAAAAADPFAGSSDLLMPEPSAGGKTTGEDDDFTSLITGSTKPAALPGKPARGVSGGAAPLTRGVSGSNDADPFSTMPPPAPVLKEAKSVDPFDDLVGSRNL